MSLASFAEFGVNDKALYADYLRVKSEDNFVSFLACLGIHDGEANGSSRKGTIESPPSCGHSFEDIGRRWRLNGGARGVGGRVAASLEWILEGGNVGGGNVEVGSSVKGSVGHGREGALGGEEVGGSEVRVEVPVEKEVRVDGKVNERFSGECGDTSRVLDGVVPVRGPNGGLSVGRGDKYAQRCRERERKRRTSERRKSEDDGVPEWRRRAGSQKGGFSSQGRKDPLRESLEKKWQAKNALEAKKAERELALLDSEDLDAVKGLREKKVRAATERAMVQTERAHAVLAATGNVPGVQPGFCETVVDGEIVSGSATRVCSISPGSSISEKEVREMQKAYADVVKKVEELEARNSDLENTLELYKRGEKVDEQVSRMYCESVPVTVNSEGEVPMDVLWKAGDKYEGKEFLEVGPLVDGKRTVKFDRYAFSRSGAYSKDYEAFDTY